jgi:selenocysteine-specific elongation factor
VLLEGDAITPGASAWVQLELERPIGALHGDRFIVRDQSALRTLGGGHVVDAFAPPVRRRKRERLAVLAAMDRPTPTESLAALLALEPANGIDLARFHAQWNLLADEAQALAQAVPHRTLGSGDSTRIFAAGQLEKLLARIGELLAAHHKRAPDSPGLTSEQLLRALPGKVQAKPSAEVFALLLKQWAAAGSLQRHGPYLRLAGHEASLQGADQRLWERLRPWLAEGGWNHPPKLSEMLARDRTLSRDAVTRLLHKASRLGKLYVVGTEYFILAPHMLELARKAQALAQADAHRRLNVKLYRESSGISRHLSIPLVEFFDHIGFTKRDPVGRKIRRDAQAMFGSDA